MSSTDTPDTDTDTGDAAVADTVDTAREAVVEQIRGEFGESLLGSHVEAGRDITVRVDRAVWVDLARYLRSGLGFSYFNFLSGIDWLPSPFGRDMDSQVDNLLDPPEPRESEPMEQGIAGGDTRFQVFARVGDVVNHLGVTCKADVPDDDSSIDTWTGVYPGADWHERECWEMYGIEIVGHPNLRHLYLPGEFEGHPLRKDYPLLARRVKPWPGIVDVEGMPGDDEPAETPQAPS